MNFLLVKKIFEHNGGVLEPPPPNPLATPLLPLYKTAQLKRVALIWPRRGFRQLMAHTTAHNCSLTVEVGALAVTRLSKGALEMADFDCNSQTRTWQ